MRKNILVLLCLAYSVAIFAQNKKVENILNQHFKAINQQDLSSVTSLTIKGSFIQNGAELELSIYKKRPDKWRQQIVFNNSKMVVVINGNIGWEINQFAGINDPVDYDEEKIKSYAESASIDSQLWYLKNNKSSFKFLSNETLEGVNCYKLEVIEPSKKTSHIWIDSNTNLIKKTEELSTKQAFVYNEYQTVNGIVFPKTIIMKQPQGTYELVFKTIKVNPNINDTLFSKGDLKSVKQVAKEYLKTFYDLDYKKLREFYTDNSFWVDPSIKVISPNAEKSVGGDKIIADLQSGFNGVFDAKYEFEKEFYSGSYAVIWGAYIYKIPAKYFQGMMHSDAIYEFNIPMNTVLVIRDGKVLEHTEYGDWTSWAKQAQANAQKDKN